MSPSIIKPILAVLTLVFPIGNLCAQTSPSRLKIATVDMQKLFKEYHRTTEEQQKFSEEFARIQKENNERLAGIRTLEEQLQALKKKIEDPTLGDNLKREKSREFQLTLDEAKAMEGGVKTVAISPSDLAKIVFDPNFKFIEKDDSYTWESKSMLIHMDLPTTSMAITDTRY